MSALITCLNDEEKVVIGNELEKLFIFQDRAFSVQKKALLVSELSTKNFKFDAIIKGIRKLFSEDMKEINLSRIEVSIKEFMPKNDVNENYNRLREKLLQEALDRYGKYTKKEKVLKRG